MRPLMCLDSATSCVPWRQGAHDACQRFIRCAGSLCWGFPAAIGTKCASAAGPVVCFTGDGGFYYHLGELETAARYWIPVVVVVNNNGAYGANRRSEPNPYRRDESREPDRSWKFGQHN